MKTGSMVYCCCVCCSRWCCLPGHTAPLVEASRAGVAKVAGTAEPPQALGHSIEQLGQVFGGLDHFGGPPDAADAADHRQTGRASWRVRGCQYVLLAGVAADLKKKQ